MKVVIAIDSFKGSLRSIEAGRAAAEGVRRAVAGAACVVLPLADGGEGAAAAGAVWLWRNAVRFGGKPPPPAARPSRPDGPAASPGHEPPLSRHTKT
ncbi:MAG: glycerate kinase, partial [Kiritimatiellae bacterium]|nr:glycerate kinase [Kiritimatiellia bacterium]